MHKVDSMFEPEVVQMTVKLTTALFANSDSLNLTQCVLLLHYFRLKIDLLTDWQRNLLLDKILGTENFESILD